VILLDDAARVQRANRAACALLDAAPSDVPGQPLAPLLARAFGDIAAPLADRMAYGARFDKTLVAVGPRTLSITTDQLPPVDDMGPRTVCVLEDVSERIAAEREREDLLLVAESARREAEAANHAKSEFLAMMSHELRTPLNAIGGYAELLELGIRGPVTEQQRADLDRIKRSQTYLLSLINDVLNFAKIESGHLQVELDDVLLADVVKGMSDFVQPQLREHGLSFTCEACPPALRVRADAEKVQQILLNLLSNALKFTPAGGTISLRCAATHERGVVITVEDTGLGIAPEKQERIFEPFVQVDRRYKREQEGIGLGLAISRELARAMGGELSVRSAEGRGSTFELRLGGA
jgi:signal transduction histidine kinase